LTYSCSSRHLRIEQLFFSVACAPSRDGGKNKNTTIKKKKIKREENKVRGSKARTRENAVASVYIAESFFSYSICVLGLSIRRWREEQEQREKKKKTSKERRAMKTKRRNVMLYRAFNNHLG